MCCRAWLSLGRGHVLGMAMLSGVGEVDLHATAGGWP